MTYTLNFQTILLDAICDIAEIAMIPLRLFYGLLWAIAAGLGLLWRIRRYIATTTLVVGAVAVCVAFPAFPLGLAIVAAFGWATYPKMAVR